MKDKKTKTNFQNEFTPTLISIKKTTTNNNLQQLKRRTTLKPKHATGDSKKYDEYKENIKRRRRPAYRPTRPNINYKVPLKIKPFTNLKTRSRTTFVPRVSETTPKSKRNNKEEDIFLKETNNREDKSYINNIIVPKEKKPMNTLIDYISADKQLKTGQENSCIVNISDWQPDCYSIMEKLKLYSHCFS